MTADVARVVHDYLSHLSVERGLADNTIRSYRRDLRRYADFLRTKSLTEPTEITENDISAAAIGTCSSSNKRVSNG